VFYFTKCFCPKIYDRQNLIKSIDINDENSYNLMVIDNNNNNNNKQCVKQYYNNNLLLRCRKTALTGAHIRKLTHDVHTCKLTYDARM